jgi:PKD repeat protein
MTRARIRFSIRELPEPTTRSSNGGQSLVEFALVLPVILVILMAGIDFGRVYLGWVNLNNTARIAANYAATNATLMAAGNPATLTSYRNLIKQDATTTNCPLPNPIPVNPATMFPNGTALGSRAHVDITCHFQLMTPIISNIIGNPVNVTAAADFPIRTGILAGVPGGGTSGVHAAFNISPTGGEAPQTITFSDVSTGSITSWEWDLDGNGTVDSTAPGNQTFPYTLAGVYHPTLTVSDGLSTDTATRTITITAPPGPVVNFTATPGSGPELLDVAFTNNSTGTAPLTYAWDFGDGTTSTAQTPPSKNYPAGTWTITLKVTDGAGLFNTGQVTILVSSNQCVVPNFVGRDSNGSIESDWKKAGFDTSVIFNPLSPPKYSIASQTPAAGTQQPCNGTVLTVKK